MTPQQQYTYVQYIFSYFTPLSLDNTWITVATFNVFVENECSPKVHIRIANVSHENSTPIHHFVRRLLTIILNAMHYQLTLVDALYYCNTHYVPVVEF